MSNGQWHGGKGYRSRVSDYKGYSDRLGEILANSKREDKQDASLGESLDDIGDVLDDQGIDDSIVQD